MPEEKVYTPVTIADNPLPGDTAVFGKASATTGGSGVSTPSSVENQPMPTRKIAMEVLSAAFNTKTRKILAEFSFTEFGAIQIGKYQNGVSGDIRMTPNGLTTRNAAGITTFALDGETGSAIFAGELRSGSIITGLLVLGNNSIVLDGENVRQAFYDDNGIPVIVIGNA